MLIRIRPIGTTVTDPLDYESLTSWIFRLQTANQILTPRVIATSAGFSHFGFIDAPLHPELAARAWSRLTGRSAAEVAPMLLSLSDTHAPQGASNFVLREWALRPAHIIPAADRCRHVVCPTCLATDEVAYWRKSWRFATTICCNIHGSRMIDACPGCQSNFVIPRLRRHPLSHCDSCGFDLRQENPKYDAIAGRLVRDTLRQIYVRPEAAKESAQGLPCRALRRLLALGCTAEEDQMPLESIAKIRLRAGLQSSISMQYRDSFAHQPIAKRWRAARIVEDFARRRPQDFGRLIQPGPGSVEWLDELHTICANDQEPNNRAQCSYDPSFL